MAMASIPYRCNVVCRVIPQACPVPPRQVQVELTINVDLFSRDPTMGVYATSPTNPFPSQQTLCCGLNILRDCLLFHDVITPVFERLGIDVYTLSYYDVLIEIMRRGLEAANEASMRGHNYRVLYLSSDIHAVLMDPEIDWEALMLAESTLEFERTNYGMVAAKESSIQEMLNRVIVEEGHKEICVICLEELEVGDEASGMPCSHSFHGDCIEQWLKQSHYCPICRFEMPTN